MNDHRLPIVARALLALVRGPEAEFVVGDIVERFERQLQGGSSARAARGRLRREAARAVWFSWTQKQGASAVDQRVEWGGGSMGSWVQDTRLALRGVAKRPGFALTVVVTLALGIGATTTIFSVVDGVMFRPLPYDDPADLVAVGTTFPGREWDDRDADLQHIAGTSALNYRDFKERSRSLTEFAAVEATSFLMSDDQGAPELVVAASVTPDFFPLLRTAPGMGRLFLPEEHAFGSEAVALLSHSTWVNRHGADPNIIGSSLNRTGAPVTVVGVLPETFAPPEAIFGATNLPEYWTPFQPDHPRYESRGRRSLNLLARLAPDVTLEQARAELQTIADALAAEYPDGNVYPNGTHFGAGANALHAHTVGTTGRALGIFFGASALLLLIAALNSATLLLARALDRMRELGVRSALGAGQGRLVRMLLTESVFLSVLGGALGSAIAYGGVQLFIQYAPSSLPRTANVSMDARVLVVALIVSIGAGVLAGLLPAWRYAGTAPGDRLRTGDGRLSGTVDTRLRSVLVGGQMALAVVLLAGAGLLANSLQRLRTVDPGFQPAGLTSFRVGTKRPGAPAGEQTWQAWDLLLAEAGAIPGAVSVAATSNPPFQSPWWAPRVLLPGDPDDLVRDGIAGYSITPGYLQTAGTELLRGRDFTTSDGPDGPFVVIVNEAFVAEHLDEGDEPIGMTLRLPSDDLDVEVVGLVEDVIQGRAEEGGRPAVYFPYTQAEMPFAQVVVRSDLPPETLFPEVRAAALRFSSVIPALDVSTMEERMAGTRATPRFQAMLIGAFALAALLLAAAGLYGSLTHAVGRRRRELGIRMAIGAERGGVLRLVLVQGLSVAGVGLAIGLLAALGLSRFLASFLYGVEPSDPTTFAAVAITLAAVATLACLRPALRATSVDPIEVLKAE